MALRTGEKVKYSLQKGMTLTEVAVALAVIVIIAATVTTALVSTARATDKAAEQMGLDSLINSVEACKLSKSPLSALSFYFDKETEGRLTTVYYDRDFKRLDTNENGVYTLTLDGVSKSGCIGVTLEKDGELIYSTEILTDQ